MDEIKWLEIAVEAPARALDEVAARLTGNGVNGFAIEDEADFLQFLEQNRQYWDYVDDALMERMRGAARIKFYVTDDEDGQRQLAAWMDGISYPYTAVRLVENDWAHSWQQYYKPMPVGERLYIIPQWEREAAILPTGRTALHLNPGLIFGTGSHASTQLCLEGVERYATPGCRVLDLGCGSGILSIAALALGGVQAVGVDIDPKAVGVAYENAAMNGIGRDRYAVRAGDVLSDRALVDELAQVRYELVLANIVADVIIPLSAVAHRFLAPGGVFLCSGIIDTRADEVERALVHNGLTIAGRWEKDGWAAFAARVG